MVGSALQIHGLPQWVVQCTLPFHQIAKPVMAHLHRLGYLSIIFIDDTLLLGDSEVECVRNVKMSLGLFEKLGFVVHPEKSVLKPTQSITYLDSVLHSKTMTVTLFVVQRHGEG